MPMERATGSGPGRLGPVELVDSPEQVRLELEIAGPMSRAFAFGLDYGLVLLAMLLVLVVTVSGLERMLAWATEVDWLRDLVRRLAEWVADPETSDDTRGMRVLAITLSVWLVLELVFTTLYFLVFETLWSGRTPGKRWTHLRVVDERGMGIGWRESLLRNLLRAVDVLPAGYLVGLLAMIFSPRVQRLGDLVAGTLVVRDRPTPMAAEGESVAVAADVEAGFRFTRDELAAVGALEGRLIRRTLRRADGLAPAEAEPILARATEAITRRIGRREPVPAALRRDFLSALLQAADRLR